mmetsp:Transcript_8779/g.18964  ORF Transcript_8779/g.18964 Transcript_8779/m.18964 type:complete len:569 (+) Transcript_8779:424-2130(+)|eukprot:CAMPEP_0168186474 /NCGR_PEP_ID=MMETSP0139_2-20121125/14453_1 /TAXON_ID=44445 /ORGANISM="Pseudo-nitzschia australis, Strain 10249 10 AB" /LENGTH=568 /DNA_ID=CAMNT_0008108487 /DNA_START=314 /DNA_END=2020 /DNA_ORIENTATION=-
MEMEDRASSAAMLERQHTNHIAALMISNAKSFAANVPPPASSKAYESSISGVNTNGKNNMNNDPLGNSARSSDSSKSSNDENSNDDNIIKKGNGGRKMHTGRWSADEHKRFLAGLDQFGTGNWKKITDMVGTRSCTQIRTHAQKYFIALQKPVNDPNNESSGYSRKKSKMLIGAEHHLNSNIKTGSSAIITGYGGGGTPIHPSGIVPVTGTMGVVGGSVASSSKNNNCNPRSNSIGNSTTGQLIKQYWGPDGLRENTGLSGMEVLAHAAITGEKRIGMLTGPSASEEQQHRLRNLGGIHDHGMGHSQHQGHGHYTQYESSLDKACAELAVAELRKAARAKNAASVGNVGVQPSHASSSDEVSKEGKESAKRKLDDVRAAAVTSMHHDEQHKAAVKDTIDRKDVLDKLQAAAERQEFMRLRQEVKTMSQTILQLQQQSIESENRVMEAITDRRVTLNECKNLREINVQLKQELRRMVLLFEHSGGAQNGNSSALMAAATQGANVELMQARLTESELRYHTVTESLSRQTGVLTDQHRAILELNSQLEKERAKRQAVEFELKQTKKARGA